MAIKSKEWFLGKCLEEERKTSPLGPLARRVLDLGLRRTSKTAGHILQSCGATQRFLEVYPVHKRTIGKTSPLDPFPLHKYQNVLKDWNSFFRKQPAKYGHPRFGYNWDTLRTYLTQKYGGKHVGGGGGDSLFKLVLRLMAEFK